MDTSQKLTVLALNCTLKASPRESSTDVLLDQVMTSLGVHGAIGEVIRLVDHDVKPGVSSNEGPGDAWPGIRERILAADILIVGTPIWMGQPSSVCKRALERMDAFLSETDDAGRRITADRVAGVTIVGNEDGAHHVAAEVFQALNDVGFTIPASCSTYWTDETSTLRDYRDLQVTPTETDRSTTRMAAHLAHVARILRGNGYPSSPSDPD